MRIPAPSGWAGFVAAVAVDMLDGREMARMEKYVRVAVVIALRGINGRSGRSIDVLRGQGQALNGKNKGKEGRSSFRSQLLFFGSAGGKGSRVLR